jgi:Nuclease-related domain/UvrD-like helicase C-terminal domain/PhoH-like protein
MARMIPPSIPADAPKGERTLFARLRDDPKSNDWIVFHSFDIRRHVVRQEGEADMLVIVPGRGILCLEVKGCDVSRRGGLWIYPYGTSPVGPFRQAADAAHSIRNYLSQKDANLAGLMYHSAVVFTEIDFVEKSLEWHPWQAVGLTELLRVPISTLLVRILDGAHAHRRSLQSSSNWYSDRTSRPSVNQTEAIAKLLRRDFEYIGSGHHGVEVAETAICRFTEEQFDAVDHLSDNRRILFTGPAGTGKTFLAVEAARRSVRNRQRTVLLCFNNLLGDWLRKETESIAVEAQNLGVAFYVGTLPSLMLGIARIQVPQAAKRSFWKEELPVLAVNALLSDEIETPVFDMLLVDEAQDLLIDQYMDVMGLLLSGGLSGGHWAIFGDFERQAIFLDSDGESGLELLRRRTDDGVFKFRLRINCRNSLRIAEAVTITAGMSPGYSRVLQGVESTDVEPVFYRKAADQGIALQSTVKKLLRSFRPSEIVILSTRADSESCAANASQGIDGFAFEPYRQSVNSLEVIRFASCHAFKGLESAAIVLTDVETVNGDQAKALLYVGMSRARVQLYILMNERVRPAYDSLLDVGLKAALRKAD